MHSDVCWWSDSWSSAWSTFACRFIPVPCAVINLSGWDEEIRTGDRDAFVRQGLQEYDGSLRRKLILGVYIVPLSLMTAIIYFTNFH